MAKLTEKCCNNIEEIRRTSTHIEIHLKKLQCKRGTDRKAGFRNILGSSLLPQSVPPKPDYGINNAKAMKQVAKITHLKMHCK